MRNFLAAAFLLASFLPVASAQTSSDSDPLKQLSFLEGTWEAATQGGSAGANASADYTFVRELKGHILARHSRSASDCKGPASYDCDHSDLFYVYPADDHQSLKAIYFDNEGHVIHYDVSLPDANTAIFSSDANSKGPQFRLVYELKSGVMSGKFQFRAPGQADFKSYLEWSGKRR
jgi:hypothetical protein